nr:immunoglobulin light chain junction region [Macaca mulatta]
CQQLSNWPQLTF